MINIQLNPIDRHFARFVCKEAGTGSPLLELVASLASNAVGNGHICLDLTEIAGRDVLVDGNERVLPNMGELRGALAGLPVTGAPGDFTPLILDRDRLYLQRYWSYEKRVIDAIMEKALAAPPEIDTAILKDGIDRLFPGDGGGPDWQRIAAAAAVKRRFMVISGGPGTGKTSTVVKIMALLLEQAKGEPLRIALAAPTGKAAARLGESIRALKGGLPCEEPVRNLIPEGAGTIHRLLGLSGGAGRFRGPGEGLLPYDAVIVDEASMVPLPLMSRLASAMNREGRLILLGDRDQLASVEAGAVLGDICGDLPEEPFSKDFREFIANACGEGIPSKATSGKLPPLADSLVVLKRNFRFAPDGGIGGVGAAVRDGDGEAALAMMKGDSTAGVRWRPVPEPAVMKGALASAPAEGYWDFLRSKSPREALAEFDSFRILCALRKGPYGVASLNSLVEEMLAERGLIERGGRWYHGRPVMVTVNDYNLRLFNGDTGIALIDPESGGDLRVFFPDSDGGIRKLSPARLPAHETVYAMTVHKSQGSEFDNVLLILPPTDTEILTRELVYTAVTRARRGVEIWGEETVFNAAVGRRIVRRSGLKEGLWGYL